MIKIVGKYRGHREILDRADLREEADYLLSEYRMAFGPNWKIELKEDSGQPVQEEIIILRRQGMTNGQIAKKLNLSRHTVDVYCQRLARQGIVEKRDPGSRELYADRNRRIAEAQKSKTQRQVAEEFGMSLFNVKSILYKLRKRGQL